MRSAGGQKLATRGALIFATRDAGAHLLYKARQNHRRFSVLAGRLDDLIDPPAGCVSRREAEKVLLQCRGAIQQFQGGETSRAEAGESRDPSREVGLQQCATHNVARHITRREGLGGISSPAYPVGRQSKQSPYRRRKTYCLKDLHRFAHSFPDGFAKKMKR